jgi:hypothetical protein
MTDHHITPTPEIVQQWVDLLTQGSITAFTTAAQWGADQELEACCEWLRTESKTALWQTEALRAARRPKPPTLKEQALEAVKQIPVEPNSGPWRTAMETIIRALEALPDD